VCAIRSSSLRSELGVADLVQRVAFGKGCGFASRLIRLRDRSTLVDPFAGDDALARTSTFIRQRNTADRGVKLFRVQGCRADHPSHAT